MTTNSEQATEAIPQLELDPSLLKLDDKERQFFKDQTGITDNEALDQHIIKVQAEAWKVFPYRCIRAFGFTKLKISRLPIYKEFLQAGKTNPKALFLDFACCFGNDARKAVADGYPVENVIAADLEADFWKLGHALFKSTPETFPVPFIAGDVFSSELIAPRDPFTSRESPPPPHPPLNTLTSLTPLQGHITFIHVSAFFHLFDKDTQVKAAKALAPLLSPEPSSIIFGSHASQPESGDRLIPNSRGQQVYCFSPEDWSELWNGGIFEKGTVEVRAALHEIERRDMSVWGKNAKHYLLAWSVKRL